MCDLPYLDILAQDIWILALILWILASHINTSCHIWINHVTHEYVMSHTWIAKGWANLFFPTLMMKPPRNESISHIWMSHVTHMEGPRTLPNPPTRTSKTHWFSDFGNLKYHVFSKISKKCVFEVRGVGRGGLGLGPPEGIVMCRGKGMSHVPHMNVACHTHEWVTSHIWMRHVTHMNESRQTYKCVNHTHEYVMSHIYTSSAIASWCSRRNLGSRRLLYRSARMSVTRVMSSDSSHAMSAHTLFLRYLMNVFFLL